MSWIKEELTGNRGQRISSCRMGTGIQNTFTNRRQFTKKKNQIVKLKDEEGQWRSWGSGLEEVIQSYFAYLFHSNYSAERTVTNEVSNCLT